MARKLNHAKLNQDKKPRAMSDPMAEWLFDRKMTPQTTALWRRPKPKSKAELRLLADWAVENFKK